MSDSPVSCSIDLDAYPGSRSAAAGAALVEPGRLVESLDPDRLRSRAVDGPTALVLGGVHGDEPEGQVAALNLARELQPEQVTGRLIVIPCASPEASLAYSRLWPSGANMNRSFRRHPDGTGRTSSWRTSSRPSFSRAREICGRHALGRPHTRCACPGRRCTGSTTASQRRQMVDGMFAWNADWCCVYIDIGGTGLLVGEAERQGKIVVSTELGGGGHVTAEIHRLASSGLENVLRHFGVLEGEA